MKTTLAFDVYGTLIDTHGIVVELEKFAGDRALDFSRTWRDKQLEYSFRRGLMQNYENFSVCTRDALEYACMLYKLSLSHNDKDVLLARYRILPVFEDVLEGLKRAKDYDFKIFAFSNGSREAVESLLIIADIRKYFEDIVSVDEIRSYKPNPAVYRHFLRRSGSSNSNAWMVSSNPFDVIGAISSGMPAAWIKRSSDAVFDPWGIQPTLVLSGLLNVAETIERKNRESA